MEVFAVSLICFLLIVAWLCLTEFSYLPRSFHRGVYDFVASGYEKKWEKSSYRYSESNEILLGSIRELIENRENATILDLACGTGRVSRMVMEQTWFRGRIHSVDQSQRMMEGLLAVINTWDFDRESRISVAVEPIETAQFIESDVVALMEASELIRNLPAEVRRIRDAIKPGGMLLLTRPRSIFGMFFLGRGQTRRKYLAMLRSSGFEKIQDLPWNWRYRLIIAEKSG